MADRLDSVSNVEINWVVPADIQTAGTAFYDQIAIYKSASENTGYTLLISVSSKDPFANFITSYIDTTTPSLNKDEFYYLIQFSKTSAPAFQSKYFPTYFSLTPRELRLTTQLKSYLSTFIASKLSDEDLRQGFQLALQAFNILPPITGFTIDDFPREYEPLLIAGAQIYSLLFRYLSIAITDFSYSDQGLSLNIDRGAKIKTAVDQLLANYNGLVTTAKMEFAFTGEGLGTIQLPIGLGGNIGRGILNIADLFTALGR